MFVASTGRLWPWILANGNQHFKAETRLNNIKNSVRTAKKTTVTGMNWLTLFKEIIVVYSENYTKHKTFSGQYAQLLLKQLVHSVTAGL
jgi:hypothetical protein